MKFAACGFWLLLSLLANAQPSVKRLSWKPTDFQPLVRLPWHELDQQGTVKTVERIFREPNVTIRHAVLAAYLREVPLASFGTAFDVAVMGEGRESPDDLVAHMLNIWAERDPQAAWVRVQDLALLAGIEEGWLGYESWDQPKITVQDADAIRRSPFWLRGGGALLGFPLAVGKSGLAEDERLPLLRQFAGLWFDRFRTWPASCHMTSLESDPWSAHFSAEVREVFTDAVARLREPKGEGEGELARVKWAVALRRWLVEYPQERQDVLRHARQHVSAGRTKDIFSNLLLLWHQMDAVGLKAWAVAANSTDSETAWRARCVLMGQADETTCQRWLAELPHDDAWADKLCILAGWQPERAVAAVLRTGDAQQISDVFRAIVYPARGEVSAPNTSHPGLGYMNDFDLLRIPEVARDSFIGECAPILMEQWGDVDIGECARFGIRCLGHVHWVKKEELLGYFGGKGSLADDGILDRTFCSLRVWAVTRPTEMREWIETQKDADMRKALTWLLENPWGKETQLPVETQ